MKLDKKTIIQVGSVLLVLAAVVWTAAQNGVPQQAGKNSTPTSTKVAKPTTGNTQLPPADLPTATDEVPTETAAVTEEATATNTVIVPTGTFTASPVAPTLTQTSTGVQIAYPNAPLCPDSGVNHDHSLFHTLWDSARGCHYDHEHGEDPFTPEVVAAFPGFNLYQLLGNVGIGHTNPSSPMENTHKHGGFKWQVDVAAPKGCAVGFEGGTVAVDAYAIELHAFGRQDVELEARNHSSAVLLRQCKASNPSDKGYLYVVQLQEYGQRITPYQGAILTYPDYNPVQGFTWFSTRGPYLTTDCVGADINVPAGVRDLNNGAAFVADCRDSLQAVISGNLNANSIWTSKPTGSGTRPESPRLFRTLFRFRDNYQMVKSDDMTHPFTWQWICSSNGGLTYNPNMTGCRWNSSTMTVHEIMGDIPATWDGLAGFDTDSRPGRITAQGFVTAFGVLRTSCTEAYSAVFQSTPEGVIMVDGGCYPIKMVSAFVGRYSTDLCNPDKCSNPNRLNTPERDIYFCGNVPCLEYVPNGTTNPPANPAAVPSGWIGSEN